MDVLKWNLISKTSIRSDSGIYAWYYSVAIGDYDIKNISDYLNATSSEADKYAEVRSFLDRHLFSYFVEDSYQARIHGKLMPEFKGSLNHVSQISDSLIYKIIDDPQVLFDLKKVIDSLRIEFSSPIYIGMSDNLQSRVNKHKQLIESYKGHKKVHQDLDDRDENFAARVASRGMNETKLKVAIMYVPSDENLHNIMENILNRINYPVLGRN
jgi:hypothetical protein